MQFTRSFFVALVCSAAVVLAVVIPEPNDGAPIVYKHYTEVAFAVFNTADFTYPVNNTPAVDVFSSIDYQNNVIYDLEVFGSRSIDGRPTLFFKANVTYQQGAYGTGVETPATGYETFAVLDLEGIFVMPHGTTPFRYFNADATGDYNKEGKEFVKKLIGSVSMNAGKHDMTHIHQAILRGGRHNRLEVHPLSKAGRTDAEAAAYYVTLGYPVAWEFTPKIRGALFGCQKDIKIADVPQYLQKNITLVAQRAQLAAGKMYTENVLETLTYNPVFFGCLGGQCQCPDGLTIPGAKRTIEMPRLTAKLADALFIDRHLPKTMTVHEQRGLELLRAAHIAARK